MKEAPGTMAAVRQALAGFNNSMCKRFQAGLKNRQVVCQQFVVASRDLSDLINVNRLETDRGYVETPVLRRTLCARFDGLFDALRQTRFPFACYPLPMTAKIRTVPALPLHWLLVIEFSHMVMGPT